MNKIQPNLFFIGGMRCGSTSIHQTLEQHPEIFMSPVKEPMFYIAEYLRRKGAKQSEISSFVQRGKYRTLASYQSLFKNYNRELYRGESSHYLYHPSVAQIILDDCPNAKFIVSIRNPTDRLFSEYSYYLREGRLNLDFATWVKNSCIFDKDGNFLNVKKISKINKGFYAKLLKDWLAIIPKEQFYFLIFEEFKKDPLRESQKIFNWLKLDESFSANFVHAEKSGMPKNKVLFNIINHPWVPKKQLKRVVPISIRRTARYLWYKKNLKPIKLEPEISTFLDEIYNESNQELSKLIEKDLSLWKVKEK